MGPTPNYDKSVEFLRLWALEGPWVLTAIDPEGGAIETRTFPANCEHDLRDWLERKGRRCNLYFAINPLLRAVGRKASRADVASLAWLAVDLDPRPGEDLAAEQARALRLLQSPPGDIPPPTVVLNSGAGHWGFWKLAEPVLINGDEARAEDAKLYNLALELAFGADACHNVDRIARLPGTINRPDAKKRKKGRTEALAELVEWHEDRVHPISRFTKAPQVQSGVAAGFSAGSAIKVSGNVQRLQSLEDLPEKVSNKTKAIIAQGVDPDEPAKFSSRSEWLFFACCAMVRGDCSDDVIFSVITDPAFGISASVLDKGSNAEKYALRQIERAREDAIDKDLRILNERHAVIGNWGGKCRVIEEIWDPALKRHRLTKASFDDFRNRYSAQQKPVGDRNGQPIMKPLGHWWLGHEKRRQYDTLLFAPGHEVPGAYNLWRGFACESKPGDCSLFLEHLQTNVCRGDQESYDYLIGWMARAVQQPDSPGYSAVVMRGGQGIGKSFTAKTLGSLFGRHYLQVTDPKHLVGSFNSHLRDCVVLFGDEAFYAGDKRHESILKMLITEELITIEAKGVDAEAAANCVHLMMASNQHWVVPAAVDDRRFFVLDVSEDRKEDHAYFSAIQRQLDTGGREAFLHLLMSQDLAAFNVRKVPQTDALREQQALSLTGIEAVWVGCLESGDLPCGQVHLDGTARLYTSEFIQWAKHQQCFGERIDPNSLSALMRGPQANHDRAGRRRGMGFRKAQESGGLRRHYYMIPTLNECRRRWNELRPVRHWNAGSQEERWGTGIQSSAQSKAA